MTANEMTNEMTNDQIIEAAKTASEKAAAKSGAPLMKRTTVRRKSSRSSSKKTAPSTKRDEGPAPRPDRSKPQRVKFADRNRISFSNMDPDYVYRVVNDKDGRIAKLQGIGYELVQDDEQIGDYRVAEGSKLGRAVSKPVGNGVTGYLMKIRKDFYEEDQNEKSAVVDKIEKALKPNSSKEEYGTGLTNE